MGERIHKWFVVSYRRRGAGSVVDRLVQSLEKAFPGRLFLDLQDISPGEDFRQVLGQAIEKAHALLVILHDDWAHDTDPNGPKIRQPNDIVRFEVSLALRRGKPVIPVLVEGAQMPDVRSLPADVAPLATRQAVRLAASRWDDDLLKIVWELHRHTPGIPGLVRVLGWTAAVMSLPVAGLLPPLWFWTRYYPLLDLAQFARHFGIFNILANASWPLVIACLVDVLRRKQVDVNSPVRGPFANAAGMFRPLRVVMAWAFALVALAGTFGTAPEVLEVNLVQGPFTPDVEKWEMTHRADMSLTTADRYIEVTVRTGRDNPSGAYEMLMEIPDSEPFSFSAVWAGRMTGLKGVTTRPLWRTVTYPRSDSSPGDAADVRDLSSANRFALQVGYSSPDKLDFAFRTALRVRWQGEETPQEISRVCVKVPLLSAKIDEGSADGRIPMRSLRRARDCASF